MLSGFALATTIHCWSYPRFDWLVSQSRSLLPSHDKSSNQVLNQPTVSTQIVRQSNLWSHPPNSRILTKMITPLIEDSYHISTLQSSGLKRCLQPAKSGHLSSCVVHVADQFLLVIVGVSPCYYSLLWVIGHRKPTAVLANHVDHQPIRGHWQSPTVDNHQRTHSQLLPIIHCHKPTIG